MENYFLTVCGVLILVLALGIMELAFETISKIWYGKDYE